MNVGTKMFSSSSNNMDIPMNIIDDENRSEGTGMEIEEMKAEQEQEPEPQM